MTHLHQLPSIPFLLGLILMLQPLQQASAYTSPTAGDFCRMYGDIGFFPVLGDTTCQNYLYCYLKPDRTLEGILLQCLGSQIYSVARERCVDRTQTRCVVMRRVEDLLEKVLLIAEQKKESTI